jgi:hypothetical protein
VTNRRWTSPSVRPIGGSVSIAISATVVYWVSARITGHRSSPPVAYFDQLADAFLHGRLHLETPPATHDLTQFDSRWFVPFPPLPAILLMPYVLFAGVSGTNTVAFACVMGGINTGLVHRLLGSLQRAGLALVSTSATYWLTVMWALGTIYWYTSTQGSVWFLAHVAATTFVLFALLAALRQRAVLAGVLLGIAGLSRPSTQFLAPAIIGFVMCAAATQRRTQPDAETSPNKLRLSRWIRVGASVVIPAALITGMLFVYNKARFNSFGDFGYTNENVDESLVQPLMEYGQFNLHFVPHNLWAMLLAGPQWVGENNMFKPDPFGMSIFLTTPALAYSFRARFRPISASPTLWAWLGIGGTLIPLLTYYNTGWYQFGFRFSMDFLPVLFVLVALGITANRTANAAHGKGSLSVIARVSILFGCFVNLGGLLWFNG